MTEQHIPDPQDSRPEGRPQYVKQQRPPVSSVDRKKNRRRTALFIGITALVILAGIGGIAALLNQYGDSGQAHDAPFSSGQDHVAVIHVNGAIEEANHSYNQEWLEGRIRNAKFDKNNKGIAFIVDSPGGTIYESDATLLALMDYQEETDRPVYTYMEHLAASGGYYISSHSDVIAINRNGITGSIGVIGAMVPDLSGLLDKLGIGMDMIYSGDNKVMGQGFSPLNEEQRAIYQALSDEAYAQFVQIVAEGRDMSYEEVQALADGRIYTAAQALENGLVDQVFLTYKEFEDFFREQEEFENGVRFKKYSYKAPQSLIMPLFQTAETLTSLGKDPTADLLRLFEEKAVLQPMYVYLP